MNSSRWLQGIICLVLVALALVACGRARLRVTPTGDTRPMEDWVTSPPEEQGMDAERLSKLSLHIQERLPHIRSVLIVRHGHLVFEEYYQGLDRDDKHEIWSVTKSFTSALVGIALREGYLEGLDQKVVDFYPRYVGPDMDPKTAEITLEHLLTMTSGFYWNDTRFQTWTRSEDWIRFALELPVLHEPGLKFNYNTPASHLLSGVLVRATGMSTLEFADRYLLGPLGILERYWPADEQGVHWGGHGLRLRSRDMAKLGYLYLNGGLWDNGAGPGPVQIVPADYVQASTQKQIAGGSPENVGYGYLWWVTTDEEYPAYFAGGYGGQFIYVVPDLDLVVVITSNWDRPHVENRDIVGQYIIPAVLE